MSKNDFVIGQKISMQDFLTGNLSDDVPLSIDLFNLADTRGLITASSGMGKSWLLRLMCERISKHIQTIIIDPEGEYPTLRETFDVLIVSESGDVKPDIRSAGLLARKLAETGVSAVIDIYDLPGKGDPWDKRRLYVHAFLSGLMSIPKSLYHPMIVMIDEAHNFAPESPTDSGKQLSEQYFKERISTGILSRSSVRTLMSAGRKRGIGGMLATQRISKIDKDSIADVRNYFIGGTTLDIDRDRACEILGFGKHERMLLRDMNPGEFFTFGPSINSKGVTTFISDKVVTTHPKAGQQRAIEVPKASNHITGIAAQFAEIPAEAEAEINTLAAMKTEIDRLNREIRNRPTQTVQGETKIEYVDRPLMSNEQIEALKKGYEGVLESFDKIMNINSRLLEIIKEQNSGLNGITNPLKSAYASIQNGIGKLMNIKNQTPAPAIRYTQHEPRRQTTTQQALYKTDSSVTMPQQRILDAIAWLESVRLYNPKRTVIAFLAGQSPRSSGYTNNLGALRSTGMITYPSADSIAFTNQGRASANHPSEPIDSIAIQDAILSRLPRPQARILKVLIDANGQPVDRALLANKAGQSMTSSGYTNNLGALRSLGVIDYPDAITARALEVLWV